MKRKISISKIFIVFVIILIVVFLGLRDRLVMLVRNVVFDKTIEITTSDMEPTVHFSGVYKTTNLNNSVKDSLKRFEIVFYLFYSEVLNSKVMKIGRIVGLPGEKIELIDGKIIVNGSLLKEEYAVTDRTEFGKKESLFVPNDSYLIMNDNRASISGYKYYVIKMSEIESILGKCVINCWKSDQ